MREPTLFSSLSCSNRISITESLKDWRNSNIIKHSNEMNFAHFGTFTLKWMTSVRTWGFWLPDWPFDVQYFLTVQREVHIWGRGRPLREAEEGRENKPTAKFLPKGTSRTVKEDALIYLGSAIQVKLGLLDLLASLQVADKTCSDCRNNKNHTMSQRCKRQCLKYRSKVKSVLLAAAW